MTVKIIVAAVLSILGAFLIFGTGLVELPSNPYREPGEEVVSDTEIAVEEVKDTQEVDVVIEEEVIVEVQEEAILPEEPLESTISIPSASLSGAGVFIWTNTQRFLNGVSAVARNNLLDEVSANKVADMFERQYFAHAAPTGEEVGDVASDFGYEYILIGENLALGDFENSQVLVQAWMDSPGHRENILNERYDEIGVAVGKRNFEGRETWLAVQSFGLPLSVCDKADKALLDDINEGKEELARLVDALEDFKEEIDSTFPKRGPAYVNIVNKYNSTVNKYNSLLNDLNDWVSEYNAQIKAFNTCIKTA